MSSTALSTTAAGGFDLSPQTFEQALTFAKYMADSDMVPKDYKGKPGNCLIAMQWGMEVGLKPMQALQNIAVINGRPALWGDSVIALVRASAVCEHITETQTDDAATCKVKRRGEPEQVRVFSRKDAQAAGLLGKQGPWTQYPKRMMQMRARAFALRDVFPDVLKGLPVAEEVMDAPPEPHRDMGTAEVVQPAIPPDLLAQAEEAAAGGQAKYEAFFRDAGKDSRRLLAGEHPRLKQVALDADAARTLENTPAPAAAAPAPAAPVDDEPAETVPADIVEQRMRGAATVEVLDLAADQIYQASDESQMDRLFGIRDELRARLEGASS